MPRWSSRLSGTSRTAWLPRSRWRAAPRWGYRRGGLPEFVVDGCGVLVAPGDVLAAAAEVDRVCAMDRAACRAHAVEHCSLDRMVDGYLDNYVDLTSMGRAA